VIVVFLGSIALFFYAQASGLQNDARLGQAIKFGCEGRNLAENLKNPAQEGRTRPRRRRRNTLKSVSASSMDCGSRLFLKPNCLVNIGSISSINFWLPGWAQRTPPNKLFGYLAVTLRKAKGFV